MRHLFSAWPEVSEQILAAGHIMLFCDFDGTLAPIVERPEMAMMSGKLKRLMQSLAQQPRFTISIVSGRSLSDLRKRVGIKELIYAGNHGMEIEGPGIRFVERSAMKARPTLRLMHRLLTQALGEVKGTMVEDKGLTLSIHYRQADEEDEKRVKSIFNNVVDSARSLGEIRVTAGKKVLEVRPAVNWDKGRALVFLMQTYASGNRKSSVLPIYLGDDVTDEDGFRVIEERGGISVHVGREATKSVARYYLRSPDEVGEFQNYLLDSRIG